MGRCFFESRADRGFTSAYTHTFKDEYTREIAHKILACARAHTNIQAHAHAAEATAVLLVEKRETHVGQENKNVITVVF